MPLSDYERRLLDDIEAHLLADPRLAKRFATLPRRSYRVSAVGAGLIAGVAMVSVGLLLAQTAGTVLAVLGFIAIVASTSGALLLVRPRLELRKPRRHRGR
jgi:hypothetical protein